jgi:hypothetical protein
MMPHLLNCALAAAAMWLLSGCSTLLPIGEHGRFGYMALECRYLPPIGAPYSADMSDPSNPSDWP